MRGDRYRKLAYSWLELSAQESRRIARVGKPTYGEYMRHFWLTLCCNALMEAAEELDATRSTWVPEEPVRDGEVDHEAVTELVYDRSSGSYSMIRKWKP